MINPILIVETSWTRGYWNGYVIGVICGLSIGMMATVAFLKLT